MFDFLFKLKVATSYEEYMREQEITDFILKAVLIALFLGLIAMFIYPFAKHHHDSKNPKSFEIEEAETIERSAVIIKKQPVMKQTGSAKLPSHEVLFEVLARFDDGKEKTFLVDEDSYSDIPENCNITLMIQDDELVDFKV